MRRSAIGHGKTVAAGKGQVLRMSDGIVHFIAENVGMNAQKQGKALPVSDGEKVRGAPTCERPSHETIFET